MVIGQKMQEAAEYVRANPGCSKRDVAVKVGPHGSNAYGYAIVDRAIKAGLIRAEYAEDKRRYTLFAVEGKE